MTEGPSKTAKRIQAALVIFPTGLIVLGVVSMIWHLNKKEEKVERSIRYAAGLMKEINAPDLQRYEKILSETTDKKVLASFMESTVGPENMGYSIRRVNGRGEAADRVVAIEVELSGTKRPRDLVLVVGNHAALPNGAPSAASAARGTAVMLSVAHALTGEPQTRSIRFISVEDVVALERYYEEGLSVDERVSHVVLVGPLATVTDSVVLNTLHLQEMGTVVERPDVTGDAEAAAKNVRELLLKLAGRL